MIGNNPTPVRRYKTKLSYRDQLILKRHTPQEIAGLMDKKRKRDELDRRLSIKLARGR